MEAPVICFTDIRIFFLFASLNALAIHHRHSCPQRSHQFKLTYIDFEQQEAYALPYEEISMLTTSKIFRQANGRPMLYILEEKLSTPAFDWYNFS